MFQSFEVVDSCMEMDLGRFPIAVFDRLVSEKAF